MTSNTSVRDEWFAALDGLTRNEELLGEIETAASNAAYGGGDDDPTGDQWCGKVADNVGHDVVTTFRQAARLSDGVRKLIGDQIDHGFAEGQFSHGEMHVAVLEVLDQSVRKTKPNLNFSVGILLKAES